MFSQFILKKDFLLLGTYLKETLQILTYAFDWLYFTHCLTNFSSINHLFLSLCMVFDSISSNVDEVLSINPSTNVFIFGDFNVYHKDWLTYSGGTDQPGELSQMTLLRWLTFLLGSQTMLLIVLLFWIYSFF